MPDSSHSVWPLEEIESACLTFIFLPVGDISLNET